MATIKDIAKVAKVSQATVSNVLNGKDNVSSDKIRRVMKAVEDMGYVINEKAQNLRKGTAKILAVVVPNLYDKTYIDFFSSFKDYAERKEYTVDLYITNDDDDYERKQIQKIKSRMTEGVAVFTSISDGSEAYYEAGFSNEDVVFISNKQPYNCKFIGYDNIEAGKEIAKKILQGNYEKVALLTGPLTYSGKMDFRNSFLESIVKSDKISEVYERVTTEQCKYQNVVRVFTHMQPDAVVTDSISLAQTVKSVYQNFYRNKPVDIVSLSPVYTIPERDIIRYEIDYRKMGIDAASYLINRNWENRNELIIESKGFSDWPKINSKNEENVLNILSIASPTTRALKTVVNLYEFNTGIKIRITESDYESMYKLVKNRGEELPYDIVRMDKDWFPVLAKSVFEPLTNIESNIGNSLDGFLPNALKNYSYLDGDIYALPGTPSIQLLFYRKDLFEDTRLKRLYYEMYKKSLEVPKTFEEYNRIAYFFTNEFNNESPIKYGCSFTSGEPGTVGVEFLMRYFSHSKRLFDENGNILLNTEAARDALRETKDSWKYSSKIEHHWWTDSAQEFAEGDTAMGIYMINHVSGFVGPDSKIRGKIGWSIVPGDNPMLGGSVLGISKYSKNKDMALDFLKWISRDDIGTATVLLGGMSAKKSAYDDAEVNDAYPWFDYAKKCFKNAQTNYYPIVDGDNIGLKELQNLLGVAVKKGIMEHLDIDEILETAMTDYENLKKKKL